MPHGQAQRARLNVTEAPTASMRASGCLSDHMTGILALGKAIRMLAESASRGKCGAASTQMRLPTTSLGVQSASGRPVSSGRIVAAHSLATADTLRRGKDLTIVTAGWSAPALAGMIPACRVGAAQRRTPQEQTEGPGSKTTVVAPLSQGVENGDPSSSRRRVPRPLRAQEGT